MKTEFIVPTQPTPTRRRLPKLPLLATLALGFAPVAVTACATTQTHGAQLDDTNLKNKVGRALTADDVTKRTQIDVDVISGVVYLRGEVNNHDQKHRAAEVASSVEGVKYVDNQLSFPRDSDVDDGHPDAWITTSIAAKIAGDPEVKSRNIDVDTEDGVVTLSGIVETYSARERAEDLAKETDGVMKVHNELEVSRS